MKFPISIFFLLILLACKNSKTLTSEQFDSSILMWEQVDYKPEKGAILPLSYTTYILNTNLFSEALEKGNIQLPNFNTTFNSYLVKRSAAMSPSLQEKYPNIRSYEGQELNQEQNPVRIDCKNDSYKIMIIEAGATYYIQELETPGIYYLYNKVDLPENTGLINE